MQKISLDALARELLEKATASSSGHTADTIFGGHEHALRQTLIAMVKGSVLKEHESPGEATLFVLRGRVRLTAGDDSWEPRTGDLLVIPPSRHDLVAVEDSAFVLTVVKKL